MASFQIDDSFFIPGKGLIIVGRVLEGDILPGMSGEVDGKKITVLSIERRHEKETVIHQGENGGLVIEGVKKNEVSRGMVAVFS